MFFRNLTMMRECNLPIVVIAALWWWLETKFFGWNHTPGSTAELFADGLAFALFAAAFAFPRHAVVRIEVRNTDTVGARPLHTEKPDG